MKFSMVSLSGFSFSIPSFGLPGISLSCLLLFGMFLHRDKIVSIFLAVHLKFI